MPREGVLPLLELPRRARRPAADLVVAGATNGPVVCALGICSSIRRNVRTLLFTYDESRRSRRASFFFVFFIWDSNL